VPDRGSTYLVPLRCDAPCVPGAHASLSAYLASIAAAGMTVVVVDGSPSAIRDRHRGAFAPVARHLPVDHDLRTANGKVAGVLTGLRATDTPLVVIADDDVRYDEASLAAVLDRLDGADLVVPQNVFRPLPWHAAWDTARTLLNRAVGHDYPGTLALRRSALPHGYDGDVLFENLELIRTVRAGGGRVAVALDVVVPRLPPTTATFLRQRVRQAYDDFAQPPRLLAALAVLPATIAAVRSRRPGWLAAGAAMAIAVAEVGRRRGGGRDAFPPWTPLLAPLWIGERAVCSWLALGSRLVLGGVRYRGVTIRRAATPRRRLRAVAAAA
jgi:hypothetical protein